MFFEATLKIYWCNVIVIVVVEFSLRCRSELTNQKLWNRSYDSQSDVLKLKLLSVLSPSYIKPPITSIFSVWSSIVKPLRALLPFLLPSIGGRAHVFKRRPSLCKPARTCSDLPLDCQVLFIFILHKNILLSYVWTLSLERGLIKGNIPRSWICKKRWTVALEPKELDTHAERRRKGRQNGGPNCVL